VVERAQGYRRLQEVPDFANELLAVAKELRFLSVVCHVSQWFDISYQLLQSKILKVCLFA
jgi:hypothetical protein